MRQENDYRRGRHVVSALNVHLVFVTKFRRGVLTGKHLDTLREVFASVCADFGAELVGAAAAPTLPGPHPPGAPVSPSYFASSADGASLETLRAYIRQQRTPGRPD